MKRLTVLGVAAVIGGMSLVAPSSASAEEIPRPVLGPIPFFLNNLHMGSTDDGVLDTEVEVFGEVEVAVNGKLAQKWGFGYGPVPNEYYGPHWSPMGISSQGWYANTVGGPREFDHPGDIMTWGRAPFDKTQLCSGWTFYDADDETGVDPQFNYATATSKAGCGYGGGVNSTKLDLKIGDAVTLEYRLWDRDQIDAANDLICESGRTRIYTQQVHNRVSKGEVMNFETISDKHPVAGQTRDATCGINVSVGKPNLLEEKWDNKQNKFVSTYQKESWFN
ncbi:hypothetical protein [Streptomyces globisporus]|uniref:hypothetical protein n=1 Tax=Streptomyces globisporus TaxID=1908 RepID=UPI003827789A